MVELATSTPTTTATTLVPPTTVVEARVGFGPGDPLPVEHCEAVERPTTNVAGVLPDNGNIDPLVMGVVLTYEAQHQDTFAGRWIDREAGGVLVIAFTDAPGPHRTALLARGPRPDDEPAVQPRPPIDDPRVLGVRDDVVIDVVQVRYSAAELNAFQEALRPLRHGSGQAQDRNRVSLFLIDPTPADFDAILALVPGDAVCAEPQFSPPRPPEPLQVLDTDGTALLLTCGGPTVIPPADWESPPPLANSDHPAAEAFRAQLDQADESFLGDPSGEWSVFIRPDGEFVVFLQRSDDQDHWHPYRATGEQWELFGGAYSTPPCEPETALPFGVQVMEVGFDPSAGEPNPDSTTIDLLVKESGCASGQPPGERLLEPQILETDEAVFVVFGLMPLLGGANCPSNPSTPVTIELERPLGDRPILDGTKTPPVPLTVAAGDGFIDE